MHFYTRMACACVLALGFTLIACKGDDPVSTFDDDEIPTLTEQWTPNGTVLKNREESFRLIFSRTFPIRVRTLDAEGNVVFERVAHSASDVKTLQRRAGEAIRVHKGLTHEEVAARKKASSERFNRMVDEILRERSK